MEDRDTWELLHSNTQTALTKLVGVAERMGHREAVDVLLETKEILRAVWIRSKLETTTVLQPIAKVANQFKLKTSGSTDISEDRGPVLGDSSPAPSSTKQEIQDFFETTPSQCDDGKEGEAVNEKASPSDAVHYDEHTCEKCGQSWGCKGCAINDEIGVICWDCAPEIPF